MQMLLREQDMRPADALRRFLRLGICARSHSIEISRRISWQRRADQSRLNRLYGVRHRHQQFRGNLQARRVTVVV